MKRVLIILAISISTGLLMTSCYFNRPVCPAYSDNAEQTEVEIT